MLIQEIGSALVGAFDQSFDFRVNQLVGFRTGHRPGSLPHTEIAFLAFFILERA